MASIAIKRGTQAQITATSIVDGQILYTTDLGVDNKVYLDVGTSRVQVSGRSQASEISFAPTTLTTSTTVQGAITEVQNDIGNVASLNTTNKTVVPAINEVKTAITVTGTTGGGMFAYTTGTTSSTVGGSVTLTLPTGFSPSNSIIVGCHVNYAMNTQAEMTSYGTNVDLRDTGIVVVVNNASLVSKAVVVLLMKIL